MNGNLIAISANSSWNIVNFRVGLIRALQSEGYSVVAISPQDSAAQVLETFGVRHIPIEVDQKAISPWSDLKLLVSYVYHLRRERPRALLTFTPKPNAFGSVAAQFLGIPVLNNMTGMAFVERSGLAKWLPIIMLKIAFRRSKTVFFQNEEDQALFEDLRVVNQAQAKLLPGSGVDLSRFSPWPRIPGATGDQFRFLLIARLLWEKGIAEYVAAAHMARERIPEARFQLLGFLDVPSPSAIPAEQVEEWCSRGVIEYLGDTDDVRPSIAASDCVVLPSYREGLPRALLEAAAMGKPIIASKVPGCRQVVEENVTGFLCSARDAASLAATMVQMAALPAERRLEMGANARSKIEREFSEQLVIERYLQALRDIP